MKKQLIKEILDIDKELKSEIKQKEKSNNELKNLVKEVEYDVGDKNVLNVDTSVVYITFTNGKCVKFFSSEWGTINVADEYADGF
jgi:hypothetical protein